MAPRLDVSKSFIGVCKKCEGGLGTTRVGKLREEGGESDRDSLSSTPSLLGCHDTFQNTKNITVLKQIDVVFGEWFELLVGGGASLENQYPIVNQKN